MLWQPDTRLCDTVLKVLMRFTANGSSPYFTGRYYSRTWNFYTLTNEKFKSWAVKLPSLNSICHFLFSLKRFLVWYDLHLMAAILSQYWVDVDITALCHYSALQYNYLMVFRDCCGLYQKERAVSFHSILHLNMEFNTYFIYIKYIHICWHFEQ